MFSKSLSRACRCSKWLSSGRTALVCGLLIIGWSATSWGQTMTAEQLLRANQKTWAAIHTFEMELEIRSKWVNEGVAQPGNSGLSVAFWAKGKGFERLTYDYFDKNETFDKNERDAVGKNERHDHLLQGGEEYVWIGKLRRGITYDFATSKTGEEFVWSTVGEATKRPATQSGFSEKRPYWLQELPGSFEQQPGSFQELISDWKPVVQAPNPGAREQLWTVRAVNPQPRPKEAGSVVEVEMTFNASRGFLIQKLDVTVLAWKVDAKADDPLIPSHLHWEVTRFRNFGQGIDFPEQVKFQILPAGPVPPSKAPSEFSVTLTAKKLTVNTPLSAAANDFRIPENTVVIIEHKKPVQPTYAVWGPKNVPLHEFANRFELNAFRAEQEGRSYAAELIMYVVGDLLTESFGWIFDRIDAASAQANASTGS